jgi:dienelactone hydrolase
MRTRTQNELFISRLTAAMLLAAAACKSGSPPPEATPPAEAPAAPAGAGEEVDGVRVQEVSYTADGVTLKGYLAHDAKVAGPRPGVLVVHEWWGHNDYTRKRARMLAAMGYTALAVDMYGDGKQAAHPEDAQKFMMEVMSNMPIAVARFEAAKKLLSEQPTVDVQKIAAIGYCFGGAVVLHMARTGMDLDGVASFHGNLATQAPAKPGAVKAKIFVAHGADDGFIPAAQIDAFKKEMADAGADLSFVAYPGAKHGFTNPAATENGEKFKIPLAYNAEADQKSWTELEGFLKKVFGA